MGTVKKTIRAQDYPHLKYNKMKIIIEYVINYDIVRKYYAGNTEFRQKPKFIFGRVRSCE